MAHCFITRELPGNSVDRIAAAGHTVNQWSKPEPPSPEELKLGTAEADGLLCLLTDTISAEVLDASPGLRVVSTMAVGVDHIDLAECRKRGIAVGNTPGVLTDATADLTMALLLAVARRVPEGMAAVREGRWTSWDPSGLLGMELRDRTLGIVGAGRIGQAVAQRAKGFGMKVITSGRPDGPNPGIPLDELLGLADIVTLHCPLTPQTHHLVNQAFLEAMQNHALLVNTSRGSVVDQKALIEALEKGLIGGAALDVTDPEPLPADDPLLSAPNLLVLPHLGSATVRTREAMANIATDNLLAGLDGLPLPHPVT